VINSVPAKTMIANRFNMIDLHGSDPVDFSINRYCADNQARLCSGSAETNSKRFSASSVETG